VDFFFVLIYLLLKEKNMEKFIITEEEKSRILEMHQTATSRQYLMEQDIQKAEWANKQSAAIKNLTAQYQVSKYPITPVVIGPYCLVQVQNIAGQSAQVIKDGGNYQGDIIGWVARLGLPCIQALKSNEVGYFSFHPAGSFRNFNVSMSKLDNTAASFNECFNQIPLATIQLMWANIAQAGLQPNLMAAFKTNVLAYQKNPADATKGYDKITGNASVFLKGLKFA
jgi:hypothetical protein